MLNGDLILSSESRLQYIEVHSDVLLHVYQVNQSSIQTSHNAVSVH